MIEGIDQLSVATLVERRRECQGAIRRMDDLIGQTLGDRGSAQYYLDIQADNRAEIKQIDDELKLRENRDNQTRSGSRPGQPSVASRAIEAARNFQRQAGQGEAKTHVNTLEVGWTDGRSGLKYIGYFDTRAGTLEVWVETRSRTLDCITVRGVAYIRART